MNLNAFFRSAKFRVLLCLLALLTGIMLYSLKSGAHTDYLTRMMQHISAPARKASAAITGEVNEHLDTYFGSKAYRDENARLRKEIAALNEQLIGYDDAIEELEALRDQLGIKQKHRDFVLSEPCKVLMPVANDLTHSFLIDQGEEDGITLNAPVICADGLIGVITELSAHYATVTTMLSPELSIGAVILQTGDSGIVEGDLRYAVDDRAVMMYIDEHSTAKEGDLIITAGTTGLFPYGLPVGNVTEIDLEESGLSRTAHLAPSVDFSKLESVTVLLDFEGKGESFGES
ncbi:MAG: rod shape-determining protein MreC [Oscillospiraceae bacterium]|jgi:rod shape-determining protein MreC|nr:rod shape-determining protein MreC [Oscillospiraceae bacterium]